MQTDTRAVQPGGPHRRIVILIGLALTLGLVLARANEFGERVLSLTALQSRDLFWWPLLCATLAYVVAVERRPLRSIGLRRPTWMTLLVAAGAVAVSAYVIDPLVGLLIQWLNLRAQPGAGGAQAILSMPAWYRVLLVTRAALAEEVVFRGYAIERIEELTGSRVLAGSLSLAAFVAAHLAYWGWVPLIGVGAGGLLLTAIYLWRRDLLANIAAHFVVDAVSILF